MVLQPSLPMTFLSLLTALILGQNWRHLNDWQFLPASHTFSPRMNTTNCVCPMSSSWKSRVSSSVSFSPIPDSSRKTYLCFQHITVHSGPLFLWAVCSHPACHTACKVWRRVSKLKELENQLLTPSATKCVNRTEAIQWEERSVLALARQA